MPADPRHLEIGDTGRRLQQDLSDVRQRLSALERQATIQYGTAPPTLSEVRDGTPYAMGGLTPKLWLRVNGTWKATTLS